MISRSGESEGPTQNPTSDGDRNSVIMRHFNHGATPPVSSGEDRPVWVDAVARLALKLLGSWEVKLSLPE